MKLIATRSHGILLVALVCVFGIVDFYPSYGPPFFRYMGSDPNHPVWNLGWPIVSSIYDKANAPHWFTMPVVFPALLIVQALVLTVFWLFPLLIRKSSK